MTTYVYKAKDGPLRTVEGELTAESRAAALARLDAMGYIPLSVEEKTARAQAAAPFGVGRIRPRAITMLTRQLGSLVRSGVPILRALSTIAAQAESPRLQGVVEQIEATVRDGHMLSEALARHPRLFSPLYVGMVRAGESAGKLDTVLFRLAEAREQEEATRRKVRGALAYPALVLTVGVATVIVLLAFFLPKVVDLYRDYRVVPLPTRILIAASRLMQATWHWIVLLVILVAAVFRRLAALDRGRLWIGAMTLSIPGIRRFVLESDLARFSRTLALLLESGIPVDRALALSTGTLRNAVLRAELDRVREQTVQQGRPFSEGLRVAPHIPPMMASMAAVGEESGRVDQALNEVAAFYELDVDQQSRLVVSLLEPILILGVGAVVGFIVGAMLLPIFQLGTTL